MNELRAMRIFVRVVEAGTFTHAADSLGMPKGSVTRHVQALELRLRARLLHRTTRRMTLTPEGAAYYARTLRLLHDFDDMEASMTGALARPSGRLRLDVASPVAQQIIVPALAGFCERYPEIQIDLGVSDRPVDLLADNVDCVIRGGEIADQSLVARRIGDMPWATVAAPAYVERHGAPAHPAEIAKQHLLVGLFAGGTRRLHPHAFARDGEYLELTEPYRVAVNDSAAHLGAVLHGFGLSQIPMWMAAPCIERGELLQLLPGWVRKPLPVHIAYLPNRHLNAKVRAFVDWVAALFLGDPKLQRI